MNFTEMTQKDTMKEYKGVLSLGYVPCDDVELLSVDTSDIYRDNYGNQYMDIKTSDGEAKLFIKSGNVMPELGLCTAKCKVSDKGMRMLQLWPKAVGGSSSSASPAVDDNTAYRIVAGNALNAAAACCPCMSLDIVLDFAEAFNVWLLEKAQMKPRVTPEATPEVKPEDELPF